VLDPEQDAIQETKVSSVNTKTAFPRQKIKSCDLTLAAQGCRCKMGRSISRG
jgi:hypothetical protein